MYKSASRREQTPEFEMYLFKRMVSSFTAAGFSVFAGLSHFLKGLSSFLNGLLYFEADDFPSCLFLSYGPPFEKEGFLLFLFPLFPPRVFILKKFLQRYENN